MNWELTFQSLHIYCSFLPRFSEIIFVEGLVMWCVQILFPDFSKTYPSLSLWHSLDFTLGYLILEYDIINPYAFPLLSKQSSQGCVYSCCSTNMHAPPTPPHTHQKPQVISMEFWWESHRVRVTKVPRPGCCGVTFFFITKINLIKAR